MKGREAEEDREDEDTGAEAADTGDTEVDMERDDCALCWWRAVWDRRSAREVRGSDKMGAVEDGTV